MSKYSLLRYRKNPKVEPNWSTRGDTFRFFIHSVANHQKKWRRGALLVKNFFEKSLTMPKNWKRGPFGIFQHPFCRKTPKNWRGPSGEKIFSRKKVSQSRKVLKGSKGVPLGTVEFFRWCKKTLQTFAPLSRDFQKFMKIVRKVDHSEWDCQLKKTTRCKSLAFFFKGKGAD